MEGGKTPDKTRHLQCFCCTWQIFSGFRSKKTSWALNSSPPGEVLIQIHVRSHLRHLEICMWSFNSSWRDLCCRNSIPMGEQNSACVPSNEWMPVVRPVHRHCVHRQWVNLGVILEEELSFSADTAAVVLSCRCLAGPSLRRWPRCLSRCSVLLCYLSCLCLRCSHRTLVSLSSSSYKRWMQLLGATFSLLLSRR